MSQFDVTKTSFFVKELVGIYILDEMLIMMMDVINSLYENVRIHYYYESIMFLKND